MSFPFTFLYNRGTNKPTFIKSPRIILKQNLIVFTATDHLLACGSQENCVLVLSRVAALDVAQRRIGINNASITQALQSSSKQNKI